MWLATAGAGISCLIPAANNTYKVKNIRPRDGLGSDRINTLVADKSGNIWAGTANGVSRIRFSEKDAAFSCDNGIIKELSNHTVRCSAVDYHGVFFGTADAGIVVYDPRRTSSITKQHGLSSNNIYSCIFDSEGNLWIGTDKGIDKISFYPHTTISNIQHYGKSEGFTGIETMQNSVCLDNQGKLWFGTVKSATVFNPAAERELQKPEVHITGMHLFFDAIEKTAYGKNTQAWYPLPETLELPYDQNHVSFEVIGIEQANPEAVRYKWVLAGFDKKWSPPTEKREAVYSNNFSVCQLKLLWLELILFITFLLMRG